MINDLNTKAKEFAAFSLNEEFRKIFFQKYNISLNVNSIYENLDKELVEIIGPENIDWNNLVFLLHMKDDVLNTYSQYMNSNTIKNILQTHEIKRFIKTTNLFTEKSFKDIKVYLSDETITKLKSHILNFDRFSNIITNNLKVLIANEDKNTQTLIRDQIPALMERIKNMYE